ncbi:MAG: hypothetical protein AAGI24_08175 [Pseudomonadota bacterium]
MMLSPFRWSCREESLGKCMVLACALLLTACVNQTVKSTAVPQVKTLESQLPEAQLLDVGVQIFDPGLDTDPDDVDFLYPEVRRAEARYMPYLLVEAIQSSGAWGAVRVVPNDRQAMDILVAARIVESHGEELKLAVTASDATGAVWLDKEYESKASRYSYETTRTLFDPFQAVYNQIANDLLEILKTQASTQLSKIRLVNELRFAQSFSPDAFEGYLAQNSRGIYEIQRLPALDDPMLLRVRKIRERDYLFIDTLQDYYASFNGQMLGPYQEWRKQSYTEAVALQELRAESQRRLIAGVVAVAAGIAGAASDNRGARAAGNVAIAGGGYLVKSGLDKRAEADIHVQALEELGVSLEAEIAPQIIELDDRTITLTGTVQDQYDQWRELLRQIYKAEVGVLETPVEGEET